MYRILSRGICLGGILDSVGIMLKKYTAIYNTASRAVCNLPSDLSV